VNSGKNSNPRKATHFLLADLHSKVLHSFNGCTFQSAIEVAERLQEMSLRREGRLLNDPQLELIRQISNEA
jgi:hypothetical protein